MRFSVIIPVYNVESYLEACLKSVVFQNFSISDFEIIIVNDCTPDNSMEIACKFANQYKNIRIINHDTNKHLGGARNTGIKEANGEYIFFLDSDDRWEDNLVLTNFDKIIANTPETVDFIKSSTYNKFGTAATLKDTTRLIMSAHDYLKSDLYFCNVWTACYRRTFLVDNNLFFRENIVYEDTDWTLKVTHNATLIINIDYPFYGYRTNQSSITNTPCFKHFHDNVQSAIEVYKYINDCISNTDFKLGAYKVLIKILLSLPRYSRNYTITQSLEALKPLRDNGVLIDQNIPRTKFEQIVLFSLQYIPVVQLLLIRSTTIFKRRLLKLSQLWTNPK